MSLRRISERRETVVWEPSDGLTVAVQVEYLGRKTVLHVDQVQINRVTWVDESGDNAPRVDVAFTTVSDTKVGNRFARWAWHSNDEPGARRILAEVTDAAVVRLLADEAPEVFAS